MSVLVTGGAGYIGSHMALELLDAGEEVVILDDLSSGAPWVQPEGASFVKGDVGDQALVADLIRNRGIESIIHFAAFVVVPESVTQPLRYYFNNTVKSRALIEVAVKSGIRHFIFSSTAAVYGMTGDRARRRGRSPAAGVALRLLQADDRDHARRRRPRAWPAACDPALLQCGRRRSQGPRGPVDALRHAPHQGRLPGGGRQAQPYMELFGTDYPTRDGTCLRDYIHVSDLTSAHMAALRHLRSGGASDTFNCGYGRGVSVREVIDAVKRVSGRDFEVRDAPRRPGDPAAIIAAPDKIRASLSWAPRHDRPRHHGRPGAGLGGAPAPHAERIVASLSFLSPLPTYGANETDHGRT